MTLSGNVLTGPRAPSAFSASSAGLAPRKPCRSTPRCCFPLFALLRVSSASLRLCGATKVSSFLRHYATETAAKALRSLPPLRTWPATSHADPFPGAAFVSLLFSASSSASLRLCGRTEVSSFLGSSASSSASPRLRVIFLLLSTLSLSCTHQQIVKTTAPPTIWDRQIHNAIDAGDGDYRLRALRERVGAEPENIAVRIELAKAYRERNYPEIALEISRLAIARFPESGDAQLSLVRDLRAVNRRPEAIGVLEAFLKTHPTSGPEYWSWLGILRDESGLWPSGEAAHRKAIEAAPADDSLHNNLGYNLIMQKKSEDAAAEFREALRLNPRNEVARNNLATALALSNATAEAVATWQTATDPASAHNNLAAVWMEKGNYPEARKELDVALGYNRSHSAALRNLELLTRLDGQPATLNAAAGQQPARSRWMAGLKRLFVGPLDDSKDGAGKSASSH